MRPSRLRLALLLLSTLTLATLTASLPTAAQQPFAILDLATVEAGDARLTRVLGSTGEGRFGVPVAGGHDLDDDGFADAAVAFMTASPFGRSRAGEVVVVFGDGTVGGTLDTAGAHPRLLHLFGDQNDENAGHEIWMDDVTGDGVGDLLIGRQGFQLGAGALTILAGEAGLRGSPARDIDLRQPPADLELTHLVGNAAGDRLSIWMRTGDVDGDGIADIVVGADQESHSGDVHGGAVYVVRGGAHLVDAGVLGLGAPALTGQVARILAPPGASELHLGATCQIADLDGDGRGEVLMAAALNRAGAVLGAAGSHATGGTADGTLFIAWDEHFETPWPAGYTLTLPASAGPGFTELRGASLNRSFGEEILGNLDIDGDGATELFVGDLVANGGNGPSSGAGYLLGNPVALSGLDVAIDALPPAVVLTTILGPSASALGADTVAGGDLNGDGLDDLAFCSPTATVAGRVRSGVVHLLLGRPGGWPALLDTAALGAAVQVLEIRGAEGRIGGDEGDIVCYSAAAGDLDGDGLPELVVNEMEGNGTAAIDVGNLVLLRLADLLPLMQSGFESGDLGDWSRTVP